jgi:hypothetical protein
MSVTSLIWRKIYRVKERCVRFETPFHGLHSSRTALSERSPVESIWIFKRPRYLLDERCGAGHLA